MVLYELADLEEEINRCKKLYPNFKEAEPFITEIYKSADHFFKKHPAQFKPDIDAQCAESKIRQNESLKLSLPLETKGVAGLLKVMADAIKKTNPKMKGLAKEINDRVNIFEKEAPSEISKEDVIDFRDSLIKEGVLERDLATFLFSFLLSSFYRQQLQSILEVLRTDLWEGGNCPACGEKPHFGILTPDEGRKQLECWLCGAEWMHTRIKCPFCDNEDREKLGYFTVEDIEKCRVQYCNACCHYYKVFDLRKFSADGSLILPVHNLATIDYDLIARQEGFTPGSGLEWVNEHEVSDRQD